MTKTIVLAFDIERSGAKAEHHTIAIGASVVDENFTELDVLFLPGYVEGKTKFETRCWDEFWSYHEDKLEELKYTGKLTFEERQREMIELFQEFRAKWEGLASQNDWQLEIVADNNVYDGGFINLLLFEHTNDMPLPYNTSGKYRQFWETHSEQRGLLMAIDPEFKGKSGFSNRLKDIYDVPEPEREHDHNPANDAYTIAFEQQVLLGIRDGRIKMRVFPKKYPDHDLPYGGAMIAIGGVMMVVAIAEGFRRYFLQK